MQVLIPFLIYLAAEIYIFVTVGSEIGPLMTIGEVLLTGWLGIGVIRGTGAHITDLIRQQFTSVNLAGLVARIGGARILAGLLFLLPGFVTDSIGLVLFLYSVLSVPLNVQHAFRMARRSSRRQPSDSESSHQDRSASQGRTSPQQDEIIEGQYTEKD